MLSEYSIVMLKFFYSDYSIVWSLQCIVIAKIFVVRIYCADVELFSEYSIVWCLQSVIMANYLEDVAGSKSLLKDKILHNASNLFSSNLTYFKKRNLNGSSSDYCAVDWLSSEAKVKARQKSYIFVQVELTSYCCSYWGCVRHWGGLW